MIFTITINGENLEFGDVAKWKWIIQRMTMTGNGRLIDWVDQNIEPKEHGFTIADAAEALEMSTDDIRTCIKQLKKIKMAKYKDGAYKIDVDMVWKAQLMSAHIFGLIRLSTEEERLEHLTGEASCEAMADELELAFQFLRALGNDTRFQIVNYLLQSEQGTTDDIADIIEKPGSTASSHITMMREVKLITSESSGRNAIHRLNIPLMELVAQRINE